MSVLNEIHNFQKGMEELKPSEVVLGLREKKWDTALTLQTVSFSLQS